MSLRARLILLVLLPSIPLVALTFHLTDRVRGFLVHHAEEEMRTLAMAASNELRSATQGGQRLLESLAHLPGMADGDPATCRRVFHGVLGEAAEYGAFYVADAGGNVLCHKADLQGPANFAHRDYFQGARDGGRFTVGAPVIGLITGRPVLPMAHPLTDDAGRFRGILYAGLDLRWFGERFARESASRPYRLAIWAEDGTVLYRHPEPDRWIGRRIEEAGITRAVVGRQARDGRAEAASLEGTPSFFAIVGTEDWSGSRMAISVGLEQRALFAEADRDFERSIAILLAVLAATFTAAFLLAERGIRRKAVALETAAGRIAAGELEARSGLRSRTDELGRLGASFDHMAATLQRETRYLRMLSEADKCVVRARGEASLLHDICRVVVEHGNYRACWVGYASGEGDAAVEPKASAGVALEALPRVTAGAAAEERAVTQALRARSAAVAAGQAALPLLHDGDLMGAMVVLHEDMERFRAPDMELLAQLAADLAFGIRVLRDRAALERHAVELGTLVASRTQELASANRFLDSVVENIPDMIFVKDAADLRFVRVNRAAEALLGYSRAELLGRDDFDLFPRELAEAFVASDRRVLEGGGLVEIEEEPVCTRHRGTRLLHTRKFSVVDETGRPRFLVGIAQDVTERKGREREIAALYAALEQRAAQLQAANRELEAFSYSVSHDLRAPLHAVGGFADALREDYFDRLDEQGRHYLERIRAGATRMDGLIEALLSLSRIARAELSAREVDLSALAQQAMAEIREGEPARRCRIAIEPGMSAYGDESLLRLALTNLLGNAWKFSRGREETVIEVGQVRGEDGAIEYFVRDNGAGFNPSHAGRLFTPFHRLHAQSEFPGTGIGLAIVRRVVERHGGRVRAQSAPGEGATFYFTLPIDPRRAPAPGAGTGRP